MSFLAIGSETERWLSVLLRSLHIATVVWLGAMVLGAPVASAAAPLLVLGSGVAMLLLDLRAGRIALGELAGASVLVKLVLVAWLALDKAHAGPIFWLLVVMSSLTSHAPKNVRHWPSRPQVRAGSRASKASKPG